MSDLVKRSNFVSVLTLYKKEVYRFLKVYGQTLMGPIVGAGLFLVVFQVSIGSRATIEGFEGSFIHFVVPGLIMMGLIQNSFSNSSSSIVFYKLQGVLDDVLRAPISDLEIIATYVFAAATRGLLIAAVTYAFLGFFSGYQMHSILWSLYYCSIGGLAVGGLRVMVGFYSSKFDHLANFSTLFITPMAFLSGTFYSVKRLPESISFIVEYNPFFYMIDGMRYALTGYSDASVILGALVVAGFALFTSGVSYFILAKTSKMRS